MLTSLLLLLCGSVTLVSANEPVFTVGSAELVDGRSARVSLVADDDCDFLEDTTTLPDGSTSSVFKDYVAGKSALILSSEPDVCYIRQISEAEMRHHFERCAKGVEWVKPSEPVSGARKYSTGSDLSPSDVSAALAEFCRDRRIVQLLVSPAAEANHVQTRKKRCIEEIVHVCQDVLCCCQEVCVKTGWLFRKNKCVREETKCSTTEKCHTEIKKIGC